jgi:hypothetical protein
MDPQKLSQLDPKLRDVYQRVMDTNVPSQPAPAQTQTQEQPTTSPLLNIELQPDPQPAIDSQFQSIPMPQPTIPTQPVPTATPPPTPTPSLNPIAPTSQSETLVAEKKGRPIKRILFIFIIVALIFVVIYALFLTKVFNPKP